MKTLIEYITEANVNVPMDGVLDSDGRELAHLPYFSRPEDYWKHSRYEFAFSSAKLMKDFLDTTESSDFWMAIYDYNSLNFEQNEWKTIQQNFSKFGNIASKTKLCIYVFNENDMDELKSRCEKAKTTYPFKSVVFTEAK